MAQASENRAETEPAPKQDRPGRRFEKGQSGNPGGRPKGLARKVREVLGNDDGETVARFWAACMSGVLVHVDAKGVRVEERIDVKDRLLASKLLAERGWGKPPQYAPIEDDDPLDLAERETDELAASFDLRLDELASRRRRRDDAGPVAADG